MDYPKNQDSRVFIKEGQEGLRDHYRKINDIKHDFRNANLYHILLNFLKGDNVFDVGCGPGHFLFLVQKQGYEAVGLEADPQLIALGEKLYAGFDFEIYNGNAENLKVDKQFDNITLIDVLEHIKEDKLVVCRLKNNLCDTGRLILVIPSHPVLYGIRDRSIGHYRRYSKQQIVDLLKSCGMKPIKIRHWNALGFIPFFVSEKIFRSPLQANLRDHRKRKGLNALFAKMIFLWFKFIENRFNFHFGLSLIVVAEIFNNHSRTY